MMKVDRLLPNYTDNYTYSTGNKDLRPVCRRTLSRLITAAVISIFC